MSVAISGFNVIYALSLTICRLFAVLAIFVTLFNYIVDTYLWAAASALAANSGYLFAKRE